jgi:hypothetical protein
MSPFTPGPWTVQITGMRGGYLIAECQAHEAEASTTDGEDGASVSHANASLITAAPEMYEALQLASNVLFLLDDEVKALGLRAENVREKIAAALAQATQ